MNLDAESVAWIEERKFSSPAEVIKSGREASKLARDRNVISKPDPKNMTAWDGFTEIGWTPDKAKYAIEAPKLAQGDLHDETAFKVFNNLAHEARLAPWQAKAVYDGMHKQANDGLRQFKSAGADANRQLETALRSKWPGKEYDQNKELAQRAFAYWKVDGVTGAQIDAIFGAPQMVELFHKIGSEMGEDKLKTAHGGNGAGPQTAAAIEAEIRKQHGDAVFVKVLGDPTHPQHKDFVAQRQNLIDKLARARAG